MNSAELKSIISRGEDGKHQFKSNFTNVNSLAAELVAFSNSSGGQILVGVTDESKPSALTRVDMNRLNQLLSNAASQSVRPPINPQTENVNLDDGLVMVISVEPGLSGPYMDNTGVIWVKSGADKRKVTSREAIQRMFQSAGLIHADEVPAGALIFAKNPQSRLPVFIVKCVCYPGNDIHVSEYRDSEDVSGKLEEVFKGSLSFITRNIFRVQDKQNVNTLGKLEIPKIALEELLTNALVHRDYFVSAHIRIFVFDDRIEIISPGHLPNNLTLENIKSGVSNIRNPILTSFATKILPYRGIGNGVRRALKEYPQIDFEDDREGNQFIVTIKRPARMKD